MGLFDRLRAGVRAFRQGERPDEGDGERQSLPPAKNPSLPFVVRGQMAGALSAPLPVIRVDDLEAAFDAVCAAGGIIAKAIFAFPGGRRFHFIDPGGNELAVWSELDAA